MSSKFNTLVVLAVQILSLLNVIHLQNVKIYSYNFKIFIACKPPLVTSVDYQSVLASGLTITGSALSASIDHTFTSIGKSIF